MATQLLQERLKNWWLLLLSGILFLLLGFYMFSQPLASYLALSLFFAATFLVSGIFEVAYAFSSKSYDAGWGWALFGGIVNIIFGIFLLSYPALTMTVLPMYIGFVILFRSILGIFHSFSLKRIGISGWGWALFAAIIGIVFAIMMITNPVFGGLTIVAYTAIALLMLGLVQIALSLRLKNIKNRLK
ncbi:hypothetical protein A8C56_18190 [Niabella ginsenosidivorans]|uniref:HdeD protein n=1 Tax=Niabella ginsenosidivorans TaxID=1176587 RepID=A0A1A9I4T5_9BACT|nr:DUF308 domain-containing protein [Niabella ginsenosidivorans]ANH82646.1 hypothetical protein A8C56_18190 [Niabella ginsenosidivorans]